MATGDIALVIGVRQVALNVHTDTAGSGGSLQNVTKTLTLSPTGAGADGDSNVLDIASPIAIVSSNGADANLFVLDPAKTYTLTIKEA